MKRITHQVTSPFSPWQVYRNLHAKYSVCFFLDSPGSAKLNQTHSFIGFDPSIEIKSEKGKLTWKGDIAGHAPATELNQVLRKISKKYGFSKKGLKGLCGGFFGYLGYETAALFEPLEFRAKKETGYPDLYFGLFKKIIAYDHSKKKYILIAHGKNQKEGLELIEEMKALFDPSENSDEKFELISFKPELSKASFLQRVRRAKEYIEAGDIYQANLSQKFHFRSRGSALALYGRLREINPSPFSCFFKIHDLEIVSSSPERLVSKKGNRCEARPIAGTCPKSITHKKISEWRKKLLGSSKERAEHLMLVDLERNDLGRVCEFKSVRVEEFMTLEKYSHVVHLVSKVTGRLRRDQDGFDLARALFPGGTITGCPKIRCMEIIDELEPSRRGLYTGSIGYFDWKGDLDLNIVIRTLVIQKGRGTFQVGAGIVYDSEPEKEYLETLAKGEALMQALAEASSIS